MDKLCTRCSAEKPIGTFAKRTSSQDGYANWCKPCFADYERERWHLGGKERKERKERNRSEAIKRSKDYIWQVLIESKCVDCGESDPLVLEFDHQDEYAKEYNVCEMFSLSIDKIKKEIDKCEVRCANCHRRRTAIQFGSWRTQR